MQKRALAIAAILGALCAAAPCSADQWVEKMLSEQEHDFGTVARGADTVYKFPIKNIYKQDLQLVSVHSSCGCTTPTLENTTLKTGETGYIVATFNTRTFSGIHAATLTAEVAWDDNGVHRQGEAQVRVHGNIRTDIVFLPGAVKFDSVDQGAKAEQKVRVTYAGRSDWKVTDVRGASEALEVELTETQRYSGRVAYDLLVRMKDSAPAGYFNEQLVLITNDDQNPRIPMQVEGRVVPQISVAPESLMLGEVARGEQVSKKILVRGKQPFKILNMKCDADCFDFKTDAESNERHVVEVVFNAKQDPGKIKETIHIVTDMGAGLQTSLTAYATVVPAASETPKKDSGNVTSSSATGDQSATTASGSSPQVVSQ
jgi:Protein of unknown function (DUF1573)